MIKRHLIRLLKRIAHHGQKPYPGGVVGPVPVYSGNHVMGNFKQHH